MHKSTIIAGVGVLVFVLILGVVVVVNSRGNTLGRVYNDKRERVGTTEEFEMILKNAKIGADEESSAHKAIKERLSNSPDTQE